ncbi:homoserine O-acetyltransferase MetX [Aurantiacibacter gangjinensis]|uniref:Homoserine O-acetyltransferase n=1 Tax=Aurantiacibacter gangjinensis TaxID=502682 RepID=A0A0G9MM15_9SPHN|nr:homoserine O-acetyltransferase [Aurantiacibacter gangjinensis]APE27784.1 Homoserine O-acetyltransferase [Aurantiacibacter gangjinensis]KLE31776.1 homoserine acetyltransferase [Aurantiacibacter gangjinensis]
MADRTDAPFRTIVLDHTLPLDSGRTLAGVEVAYETYGELAEDRSNAILIFHALTGDQFVAGTHPQTGKPGWWERMVGPGRPIDTNRYHVICANVIGSCMGSTGPASAGEDGAPFAMQFPVITIRDMVRAQVALLDALGIQQLHAVVGGSMGGMQALSFAANWPERTARVLAIATTARHSAQNIAFHEVGRQAIMADPAWNGGDYYNGAAPDKGLAVARMAAHITYLSEAGLTEKFGRRLQDRDAKSFGFDADFQVESYLRYQGLSFTDRFDANSYLYITRAMDYFDLAEEAGGLLADAFAGAGDTRFCLVSFDTDWLYTTADMREIVHALNAVAAPVSFVELSAPYGHDSFLLDVPALDRVVEGFIG